jgi:hypothetical protein
MPVTLSYPGLYIEELPSSAHTITAAPTSIAVFIGYTHPYKTLKFGEAVRIFNFTDYERSFGGLYANGRIDNFVAYAVQQFFLNGGSDAYVVGVEPKLYTPPSTAGDPYPSPTGDIGNILFTGLEPVDGGHDLTVTISNQKAPAYDIADITVTYGSRAETFRNVSLTDQLPSGKDNPDYINRRLNGVSSLVTVAPKLPATSYGTFPVPPDITHKTLAEPPPFDIGAFVTNYPDFKSVFANDGSLDKVDIFNLMVIPGVADASVLSQALAFCERKRAFFIMDPPVNDGADDTSGLTKIEEDVDLLPKSANGALYFPYLTSIDALSGKVIAQPPSGYVAGIYARTDNNRGVWKAPAGLETTIHNATGVVDSYNKSAVRNNRLDPAPPPPSLVIPQLATPSSGSLVPSFWSEVCYRLDATTVKARGRARGSTVVRRCTIAAALGTPIVGIYGPTRPARNGPMSPLDITVSRDAVCQCHHLRRCTRDRMCLLDIEVAEVLDQLLAQIKEMSQRLKTLVLHSDNLDVRQSILEAVGALETVEQYFEN